MPKNTKDLNGLLSTAQLAGKGAPVLCLGMFCPLEGRALPTWADDGL